MKSCIFYTLLLPIVYALLFLCMQSEEMLQFGPLPQYIGLLVFLISMVLPSLLCCIGWLWVQRRPIRSPETPYICFILPLLFLIIAGIGQVYMTGYDGIETFFGLFFILFFNVICSLGLIGITALLRMVLTILAHSAEKK